MNYGDPLPSCNKGVQHFNPVYQKVIFRLYRKGIIEGEEAFLWECIGTYCRDYIECYSKAYLAEIKKEQVKQ